MAEQKGQVQMTDIAAIYITRVCIKHPTVIYLKTYLLYNRIKCFDWRINVLYPPVKVCLCRPRLRPSRTKKCKRLHINATQQGLMTPYPGLHSLPLCFVRVQDRIFLHVAPKVHFDSDGEVHSCQPESTNAFDAGCDAL